MASKHALLQKTSAAPKQGGVRGRHSGELGKSVKVLELRGKARHLITP